MAEISTKPEHAVALEDEFNRARVLHRQGLLADAERHYRAILRRQPNHFGALHLLGVIALKMHHTERAVALIGKAITLNGGVAAAHNNLGRALLRLERATEALASLDKAISLRPDWAEAYNNRGRALAALDHREEALASYDKAVAIAPSMATAHSNRGHALELLRRYSEALASYDQAIALRPDLAALHNNRGNVLMKLNRYQEALASYDRALAMNPDLVEGHHNRGEVLNSLKRHAEAAAAYAVWLRAKPDSPLTKGKLLHQKMLCCNWDGVGDLAAEIEAEVAAGKLAAEPFGWQAVATTPQSLLSCASLYTQAKHPANVGTSGGARVRNPKIRIGYVSGELRSQATARLLVGVLELHDDSRFDVFGFDNGFDDKSVIRGRIETSIKHMIGIRQLSDSAAAAAIRESRIDILVNLNGYFGEHRMDVFAHRPAPIQVNYLGFPGTLGASYIDYLIADRWVIPAADERFYSEKVVCLPGCYQANDAKRQIGTRIFARAECGLPDGKFVFCCFNHNYKITPDVFDCWMRILNRVNDSVLWLLAANASAAANLRKEAAARDVDPQRLVFAGRMSFAEHLARHQLADLFLDTLPCNAHTTASDALWAGLPVLTRIGETFPGRVAASLLHAVGLPELIAPTAQAYEDLAVSLAGDSAKLASVKRTLVDNRLTTSLFDTRLFTRRLEAAYTEMFGRYRAGLPPGGIDVSGDASPVAPRVRVLDY